MLARAAALPSTLPWRMAEAALLLAVATLSWRVIEQPFRAADSVWRRRAPVLVPLGGILLAGTAALVVALHGLPRRFPPDVASVAAFYSYRDARPFREGRCFITSKDRAADYDRGACLAMAPDRPNVLLLGDSHAAQLWTGLRDAWPGIGFLQATASGCKPVLGATGSARCTALMADMLARFIPAHRLDALVIAGLWDEADIAPLRATVAALAPHVGRVVVFGPMPRYDQPAATLIARSMLNNDLGAVPGHLLPGVAELDGRMRAAVAPLATYVSPYDALCAAGRCRLFARAGVPMQFDYHHLTEDGAAVMMARIREGMPDLFDPQRSTSSR